MSPLRRSLPFFVFAGLVPAMFGKAGPDERREKTRAMRNKVLADLYKQKPELKARIKKAAGYAVFSNVGINLVLASFAGGTGVVVDKRGNETFLKMGSAGIGIGLGVKDFRGVFIFHDKEKLEKFIDKGWGFSAQADAAAKSATKGAQAGGAGQHHRGRRALPADEERPRAPGHAAGHQILEGPGLERLKVGRPLHPFRAWRPPPSRSV